jgi:hypothetical protein
VGGDGDGIFLLKRILRELRFGRVCKKKYWGAMKTHICGGGQHVPSTLPEPWSTSRHDPPTVRPLQSSKHYYICLIQYRSASMSSVAFSLNIIVGSTGNPPGTLGKALASTTLNPCTPLTLNLLSSTAYLSPSAPILQLLLAWWLYACSLMYVFWLSIVQFCCPMVPSQGCSSWNGASELGVEGSTFESQERTYCIPS